MVKGREGTLSLGGLQRLCSRPWHLLNSLSALLLCAPQMKAVAEATINELKSRLGDRDKAIAEMQVGRGHGCRV